MESSGSTGLLTKMRKLDSGVPIRLPEQRISASDWPGVSCSLKETNVFKKLKTNLKNLFYIVVLCNLELCVKHTVFIGLSPKVSL